MAWWTKIDRDGKIEIKKHDGRQPKLSAGIELRFAQTMGGVPIEKMGLYKRDPAKYTDEPNMLLEMQRKLRSLAKRPRSKTGTGQ